MNCTIEVQFLHGALRISVEDDGEGMPSAPRRGVGLASMRERAEELGGTLVIGPGAAGGTRVEAVFPVPKAESVASRCAC